MKKQIGLITLSALMLTFVAFSGVASAQSNNAQAALFTSPMCAVCQKVDPLIRASAEKYGVKLIEYDVSAATGRGVAQANNVQETPTLIVQGAQSSRLEGDMSQAQIDAAMQAAVGNTAAPTMKPTATPVPVASPKVTPTPAPKVVVKPTATPTMKPTATPTMKPTATPTMKPTATPKVTTTVTTTTTTVKQPNIQVLQPQTQSQTTTKTSATQTVPEFSLLGLGAPALVIGAMYLFMRRK